MSTRNATTVNNQGTVYLLHLDAPISEHHTAQHYIGWARNLDARIEHHRGGTGARFTQVAGERGIGFDVVRTWEDVDRNFERKLKDRHAAPRLCPVCAAKAKAERIAAKAAKEN